MGLNKLFIELSPEEVNNSLLDKWGINLFKFAQVLAMCAGDALQLPEKYNVTKEKILKKKKLLIALKHYIFTRIPEIESLPKPWLEQELSEDEFIEEFKLKTFFKDYLEPNIKRIIELEKNYDVRQGTHVKKKSILAAAWGSLVYRSGRRMNWDLLANLYEWFWEKLGEHPYYKLIRPPDDLVNFLAVQYHRHKEQEDCIYCLRMYGRWDAFTIFAKNGTFVDRLLIYIGDALDIKHNESSGAINLPADNAEINEYFEYALGLYQKNGNFSFHKTPLIIFPNKSTFGLGL